MKDEEIFGTKEYESFITFEGNRFCFALARKCKLYRYEKKIGVNFSAYFDWVDFDGFDNLPLLDSKPSDTDVIYDDEKYVLANVTAFNFSTGSYDQIGDFAFLCKPKRWITNEILLSSCHINDDSTIKVRISYALRRRNTEKKGFLLKQKVINIYSSEIQSIELTSVLTGEKNERETEDNFDTEDVFENWGGR